MTLTPRDVTDRWAELTLFDKPPMLPRLSGLGLEYALLEVYSRDRGQRAADIRVDVGQGSGDIGSRNGVSILFTAAPGYDVGFRVSDEQGRPAVAASRSATRRPRVSPGAKRLAPDLPFQSHVYRGDGENVTCQPVIRRRLWTPVPSTCADASSSMWPRSPNEVDVDAPALDRSRELQLVFGRPPRPRGRLLALREPDAGRAPQDMCRRSMARR